MPEPTKPVGFCTTCSKDIESWEGLKRCPNCGATGVPCGYENQVNVNVNTHELRILCIWAENWAHEKKCDVNVVYAIAARLRKQLPDATSLTMADEFRELKDAGYKFETNHPAADDPELPPGTFVSGQNDQPS